MIYNVDLDKTPVNEIKVDGLKAADIQGHNDWQVTRVETDNFKPITEVWLRLQKVQTKTKYPCHDCKHMKTCEWSFTDQMNYCKGEKMGKKFVIELEDKVSENAKGEKLYFVKGFNNLSLDETALKKLTPYEEPVKEEHEFQVGDVVAFKANNEKTAKIGMITKMSLESVHIIFDDGSVRNPALCFKDDTYTMRFVDSKPNTLFGFLTCMTLAGKEKEESNER